MNRHTFKDVGKRSALSNELDHDDDEDDQDASAKELKRAVEGEEEEGDDKFNEAGEVIEAFNLADEREGGHFDENMNYVFKKEKGEVDAWVAEMDEVAMEQAIGEAAKAVKRKAAEREEQDRRDAMREFKTAIQLKKELIALMQPKETVAGAMRRLSGKGDKPEAGKDAGIVRRRAPPKATENDESNKPSVQLTSAQQKLQDLKEARERRGRIDRITELADELLSRGLTGVYTMSYESLKASTQTWEYQGQADGQIHGPYTAQQLAGWKAQGYFNSVMVRPVGENHAADGVEASGVQISRPAAPVDSMYDDDIYGTDTPAAPPVAAPAVVAAWVNSDDVDFGEYVNLDQAQKQLQQQIEQRKRQHIGRAGASAHQKTTSALHHLTSDSAGSRLTSGATLGGEDEQEEEEEEEAEGMSYRRRKNTSRKTQDLPDDSDEDQ
eukprot:gene16088-18370_t